MKVRQIAMLAGMSTMLLGMSILPAPAVAQVEFDFRTGGPRHYDDRRYYRDDYRDDRRYERRYAQPGCGPRQALAAASRYVDDPRINSENRAYYEIDGYGKRGGNRGRPDGVRISKGPDCERLR